MKNPLVSIIMNCHNGERFLHESLKSVLRQNYKNWELIIVDDYSDDNSVRIIKKFVYKGGSIGLS
jgi:teichuronic acid biosynthesis glycosyltransferase TuaG